MLKQFVLTLCLTLPLLSHGQYKWATINKLEGTWQVVGKQQFELWEKVAEHDMKGKGIRVNATGEQQILEYLQIKGHPKGAIHLKASVPDQNDGKTISFYLSHWDNRNLVFENPAHDFPQKIQYRFKGKKKLKVHVSAGEKGFVLKMVKTSRSNL